MIEPSLFVCLINSNPSQKNNEKYNKTKKNRNTNDKKKCLTNFKASRRELNQFRCRNSFVFLPVVKFIPVIISCYNIQE